MQYRLLSALKNICIITLWSTLLYASISFLQSLNDPDSTIRLLSLVKRFVYFVFVNSPIWGFHLWYLFAYIYTLIAVWGICKMQLLKIAYWITPILLAVSVIGGLYSVLIFDLRIPLVFTRNFLFVGIPYFIIGMAIKSYHKQIFRHKNIVYIGFVISIILSVGEYVLNPRSLGFGSGDLYISTAPMTIAVFLIALLLKQTKDNIFSKLGRNDSLYIYIFHPLTMLILGKISRMYIAENSIFYDYYKLSYSLLVFVITIIGSILFRSCILPKYKKARERFS